MSTNIRTEYLRWLKRKTANSPFFDRLNIRRRLTFCFISVILLMLLGNAVLFWQLRLIRARMERLNSVDEEFIEVLRVHTDLMLFSERLGALVRSKDAGRLLQESGTLKRNLVDDVKRTQGALDRLPPEVRLDPSELATLESLQRSLPSYLDAIEELSAQNDWEAALLRLEGQIRPLEVFSSEMVQDLSRKVGQQRAQATLDIARAEHRIFLMVPLTAFVTLLTAAVLGVGVTRSITEPLDRLMEGSKALARGDFSHRVPVTGADELAHLAGVFNDTIVKLKGLYSELQSREAYLTEAQKLSHSGSWAWKVGATRLYWSDEAFQIYGFDRDIIPTRELFLKRVHPDDLVAVEAVDEKLLAGRDVEYDYRIVLPDHSTRYIHSVARPVTDDAAQVVEFVGTAIDVTEQRKANDALKKAFDEIKVLRDQLYKENIALRDEVDKASMFEEIVGDSAALQFLLARVTKVAPTDSTVLITGETGTGKELIARAIHKRSQRSSRAFVNVNCAAIPSSLIASELFGHEKGAFTGALHRRLGRFESAEGGTIFLDEIGELPMETQIALLRVLQEREFERVGGNLTIRADVRVIAATNRNLQTAIASGDFRSDLFYRLNVVPLEMPALRDRKEDIPVLIEYFTDRYARKVGKKIRTIEKRTLELLQSYSWPGNIRELQNVIERSVVVCETDILAVEEGWLSLSSSSLPSQVEHRPSGRLHPDNEKRMIEEALAGAHGRVSGPFGAAAQLGIPASTLESKIRSLKIDKYRFKSA